MLHVFRPPSVYLVALVIEFHSGLSGVTAHMRRPFTCHRRRGLAATLKERRP